MPVYAHTLCKISILNYRFEFRLISRICNDAPFHETGRSGRDEMRYSRDNGKHVML
jgi:hypothetical protein